MKPKPDKFFHVRERARACFRAGQLAESMSLYARILSKHKKDLEALQKVLKAVGNIPGVERIDRYQVG